MTISKRQFSHLQAMGIELWQLKKSANNENQNNNVDHLDIELSALIETKIFTDILKSLDLSIGEVTCANNILSLGLLTWAFSKESDISLTQHHLVTPTFHVLKDSAQLKQALWQKLQEHTQT
jgi:DNA polymerase III psi subunit